MLPAFEVWGCDQAMFVSWVCFGVWVPSCALAAGMVYVEALLSLVGRCGSGASVWRVGLRCCQLWFGQRRNLDPVQQLLEFVYWMVVSAPGSAVAQWLACWAHNPKVRGSKPRSATFLPRHTRWDGSLTITIPHSINQGFTHSHTHTRSLRSNIMHTCTCIAWHYARSTVV